MATLSFQADKIDGQLAMALTALGEEYPIVDGDGGDIAVLFERDGMEQGFKITREEDQAIVAYAKLNDALRAVGTLLSEVVEPGAEHTESTVFTTMGIMLDCSRNAVMTIDHFKTWLRRLAVMGFNMAMLYTEDTYEIPGEDYFGYMRGRYTTEELQAIDDYAASLGIEMIGCIQTLAHLGQILKWSAYKDIKDTSQTMLVGEKKTYELIEKMLVQWSKVFRSRRIHVGMDEACDLGRGKYLDIHGKKSGFDIIKPHMKRITALCEKHGLKPMIWSDMYFRLGSVDGGYYDTECVIPEEVKEDIPKGLELVYWDYYHNDEAFYLDWIARHRDLGSDPIMASGVWTWRIPWYGRKQTEANAGACVRACRKAGLKQIFFTMWGDDGGYCDIDSGLAGLQYVSELAYTDQADEATLEKRFRGSCSGSYHAHITAATVLGDPVVSAWLWDDPLLGLLYRQLELSEPKFFEQMTRDCDVLVTKLEKYKDDSGAGNIGHAIMWARIVSAKIKATIAIRRAYARGDKAALKQQLPRLDELQALLNELDGSFRRMWLGRNKPFGLEVIQIRLAGQKRRFGELHQRLGELIDGTADRIAEFDERQPSAGIDMPTNYRSLATASLIF